MLLVEERLFPGDELAAAMAAAVAAAGVGDSSGGAFGLDGTGGLASGAAGGGVAAAAERDGGQDRRDSTARKPSLGGLSDTEGGWGEDGTAAGSLSHLVECMLEVSKGEGKASRAVPYCCMVAPSGLFFASLRPGFLIQATRAVQSHPNREGK